MSAEPRLDESLPPSLEVAPASFERIRGALEAELQKKPAKDWRISVAAVVGVSVGVVGLVTLFAAARGEVSFSDFAQRLPVMASLLAASVLAAFAGLAPRRRWARWGALLACLGAAAMVVAGRLNIETAGGEREWLCTLTHVLAGILPVGVVLAVSRSFAVDAWRALILGLGAGVTGALLGEVLCDEGAVHAIVFHLTPWVAVALVSVLGVRLVKPRSYAP